ncbi:MAG: aldo/keto reductase [Candidatus Vecturithrix sp.]|jgi:methylglyoxal reductase|nr:aldo/keto reductase [Candidatus Vecturithrix sp.]
MKMRTIGSTAIHASVVALGTWAVGGGTWWGDSDDQQSVKAIHAAIDAGVNLIDTAPVYGWGRSEEVVGKAIHDRREKVVLATKCGLWWHDDTGKTFFEMEGHTVKRTLRPEMIRQEVEFSLKRLQTDYIDLYQTHWPSLDPEHEPIADTMECLLQLKKEGKIRAIGASNVDIAMIKEYQAVGVLDAIQPRYSMLDRAIEQEVLPYCIKQNISTLVYSPLEQGLLTGKITKNQTFKEGETRNQLIWLKPENRGKVLDMLAGWQDLTEKYHCTLAQLVIAWTVEQPGITIALCGARKPEHSIQTAKAGDLSLEPNDIQRMRHDVEALGKPIGA